MIKAVVFDMDGVLVDSEPFAKQLDKQFLKRLGYELDDALTHRLVGATMKKASEIIKEYFQIPLSLEAFMEEYKRFTLEQWKALPHLEPNNGISELIGRLQRANIPLALATSANRDRTKLFLERLKLADMFRAVVCGDDILHSKPAPDIYLAAAEKLRIDPKECVAIEDAMAGAASAKAAGMKVVGYKNADSRQDLSESDLVISDFAQLTDDALRAL